MKTLLSFRFLLAEYEEVVVDPIDADDVNNLTSTSTSSPHLQTSVQIRNPAEMLAEDNTRTTNWDKFRLLMWKNFLLQWRHKVQTVVEILIPVLFSALLVLIRYLVDPEVIAEPTRFEPFNFNSLAPLR